MKHIFLSIALGVLVFFGYVAYYVGAFRPVELSLETRGPYTAIYKVHRGAYHKIGPVIEEVETWMQKHSEDSCQKSFGHYLDDTDWVEEERLTSHGGCIVEGELPEVLPKDFKIMDLPESRYVVAKFSGAPGIGPIKVYPKAHEWAAEQNLKLSASVIEIYEILGENKMETEYLFSVEKSPNL